jgi:esterase/lipase superfamily enzyme
LIPKVSSRWYSPRIGQEILTCRWGHAGQPVLLFPTAGGDAEESERFLMMKVLAPLLEAGRIRVYSCDSAAGRTWTSKEKSPAHKAWFQNRFDDYIASELVPAIRTDCGNPNAEIIAAGASLGAFQTLAAVCRHPDLFRLGIAMSGTYDFSRWMDGQHTPEYHFASPMHFVPYMPEGAQLSRLRTRFLILATGTGDYEAPWESWTVGQMLGKKGVPNRVDFWKDYRHDWITWRDMLPKYLGELA